MQVKREEDPLISDLLKNWLDFMEQRSVRPTSLGMYKSQISNYIEPLLGEIPAKKLAASVGKKFAVQLEKEEGLSPKTARDVVAKLYQAMRWGAEQGYDIPQLQKPIKRKNNTGPSRTLSVEEQRLVEKGLMQTSEALRNAILLALKAGLTVGELCALTYEDIDHEQGMIRIHRICQRTSGGLDYLECEARTVPFPQDLSYGGKGPHIGFYLLSPRRSPLEPRLCQFWLKRYLEEWELPEDITFSALRNTYIKNLMESGVDFIEVSRRSGNKNLNDLWQKFGQFYKSA